MGQPNDNQESSLKRMVRQVKGIVFSRPFLFGLGFGASVALGYHYGLFSSEEVLPKPQLVVSTQTETVATKPSFT